MYFSNITDSFSFKERAIYLADSSFYTNNIFNFWRITPSSISNAEGKPLFFFQINRLYNAKSELIIDLDIPNENFPYAYEDYAYRSLFVPHPGDSNLYYLFLSGVELSPITQKDRFVFKYLLIDINANAGKGGIVGSDYIFDGSGFGAFQATAKEEGFWLLFRNDSLNKLYSFNIDKNGIDKTPKDSLLIENQNYKEYQLYNPPLIGLPSISINNHGYAGNVLIMNYEYHIRFNPQGTEFCFINKKLSDDYKRIYNQNLSFYSFNKKTGKMLLKSNELKLDTVQFYYFDYSPSGKYIYITIEKHTAMINGVYRFMVDSLTQLGGAQFNISKRVDSTDSHGVILGSNNKFYYVDGFFGGKTRINFNPYTDLTVHEIVNPDVTDLSSLKISNFLVPSINTGSIGEKYHSTWFKFPYNMYFKSKPNLIQKENCQLNSIYLQLNKASSSSYIWDFCDGLIDTTFNNNIEHIYQKSGIYELKVYFSSPTGFDSFLKNITIYPLPPINLPQDTLIFQEKSLTIGANHNPANKYLWSTGDTSPSITVFDSNKYMVTVQDSFCQAKDSFMLHKVSLTAPLLNACGQDGLTFILQSNADSAQWKNNTYFTGDQVAISTETTLPLKLFKNYLSIDTTLTITRNPYPVFDFGNNTAICHSDVLTLGLDNAVDSFKWSDGYKQNVRNVNTSNTYKATVYSNACAYTDSIKVVAIYCDFKMDVKCIDSSSNFTFSTQLDSMVYFINEVQQPVVYQNEVYLNFKELGQKDIKWHLFFDSFSIIRNIQLNIRPCQCNVYIPNAFSPNSDGLNDVFMPYTECKSKDHQLFIYNRWGEKIYERKDALEWNGLALNNKLVLEGVYFYIIYYRNPSNNQMQTFSGTLTVLP